MSTPTSVLLLVHPQPGFPLSSPSGRHAGAGCSRGPSRAAARAVPCVLSTHFNPCATTLLQKHVSF